MFGVTKAAIEEEEGSSVGRKKEALEMQLGVDNEGRKMAAGQRQCEERKMSARQQRNKVKRAWLEVGEATRQRESEEMAAAIEDEGRLAAMVASIEEGSNVGCVGEKGRWQ
ncbi:hypothetical protein B296_00010420 [Ensete ventricosum]|uniref:Uncharacterized protein n=1 Tax=Ensete ventricosum TaxID=4639 RepID=A0A427ALX0_ENSVE|nr:hypothetical protein B296_00010420 [Ensete ventricosum]